MGEVQTNAGDVPTGVWHVPAPFAMHAQGHDLHFMPGGAERLADLLALIHNAKSSLKLCFYIFDRDRTGALVRDALADAARRGVDVHLILDDFGSEADNEFLAALIDAGGQVSRFGTRRSQRYLISNHQKIVLVDSETAMLGGFNIADSYFAPPEENGWNDLAIRMSGPAVARLCDWFAQLEGWTANPRAKWKAIRRIVRQWDPGTGPVEVLVGGPTALLSSWARRVGRDLIGAKHIDMMMAYFSPPAWLIRRIALTSRKGGSVRLVMAGKSDNAATIGASRSLYSYMLKRGARIWEFDACKLHSKLIVADDAVYLGSANFDMRSLYLNLELMVRIEDAALAGRIRQMIGEHLPASREITREVHKRHNTLFNRLRWNLSWFLVSALDYTVSRRLNLGL